MLLENLSEWDISYHIYDLMDEQIKAMDKEMKKHLLPNLKSKRGGRSGLSLTAILTFGLFRLAVGIKDAYSSDNAF